jgi:eukaryotic-like serine/threonine-protein kinase
MHSVARIPQLGDLICGKYRVSRLLGRGAMGIVFDAVHRVTDKHFALKWLLPEVASSADGRRRFIREAKAACRLKHPGIVEVYDVEESAGSLFLVMELLLGESLESRLKRVGHLSVGDAIRILLPCMRGLATAHAAGIVHRDLKPANILICEATRDAPESGKVLDFGVSRITSDPEWSLTQSGMLVGTPSYMAPEQLCAGKVDHRADIYAFGVILYEVLCGRRPFEGDSLGQLVLHIASGKAKPLREQAAHVDPATAAVVQRALRRDPGRRFQSMLELALALEASADGCGRALPASRLWLCGARARKTNSCAAHDAEATDASFRIAISKPSWPTWVALGALLLTLAIVVREFSLDELAEVDRIRVEPLSRAPQAPDSLPAPPSIPDGRSAPSADSDDRPQQELPMPSPAPSSAQSPPSTEAFAAVPGPAQPNRAKRPLGARALERGAFQQISEPRRADRLDRKPSQGSLVPTLRAEANPYWPPPAAQRRLPGEPKAGPPPSAGKAATSTGAPSLELHENDF